MDSSKYTVDQVIAEVRAEQIKKNSHENLLNRLSEELGFMGSWEIYREIESLKNDEISRTALEKLLPALSRATDIKEIEICWSDTGYWRDVTGSKTVGIDELASDICMLASASVSRDEIDTASIRIRKVDVPEYDVEYNALPTKIQVLYYGHSEGSKQVQYSSAILDSQENTKKEMAAHFDLLHNNTGNGLSNFDSIKTSEIIENIMFGIEDKEFGFDKLLKNVSEVLGENLITSYIYLVRNFQVFHVPNRYTVREYLSTYIDMYKIERSIPLYLGFSMPLCHEQEEEYARKQLADIIMETKGMFFERTFNTPTYLTSKRGKEAKKIYVRKDAIEYAMKKFATEVEGVGLDEWSARLEEWRLEREERCACE